MMQKIKEKRHITEEIWIALEQDTIEQEAFMQILEHTCECSWCAEKMAVIMEHENVQEMPPSYLEEQILERTKHIDIQTAVTLKRTSKQLQLLRYSLQVGAAVIFSIFILGVTTDLQNMDFIRLQDTQQLEVNWQDTQQLKEGWQNTQQMEVNWQNTQQSGKIRQETAEEREEKKQNSVLNKANQAVGGMTQRIHEFANQILNGGKKR